MTIIKAIIEVEYNDYNETGQIYELKEVDILTSKSESEVEKMLSEDEVALADYISDEIGFCVNEIIGYRTPDYIIE